MVSHLQGEQSVGMPHGSVFLYQATDEGLLEREMAIRNYLGARLSKQK